MATLCFEEYARFWWTQRQSDVRIDTKLEIQYQSDLKACMRRKFVLPLYEKKNKLRKEMKELVKIGKKFVDGEK